MKNILTKREKEILTYLEKGFSTKDVAELLGLSTKTIRNHISNVILKLGVNSRKQAILELKKLNEL
ncbi:MAG TPA: response regulator transcription factor [Candidatus Coprovivens excrementavium]|nr:response regulator transcription factor [Candidatus Coprovivens excrementavium]